jgi:hypothetical protein
MPNTMKALQRAAKAATTKSYVRFTIEGTPVICSQFRGEKFYVSVPGFRNIAGFSLECEKMQSFGILSEETNRAERAGLIKRWSEPLTGAKIYFR